MTNLTSKDIIGLTFVTNDEIKSIKVALLNKKSRIMKKKEKLSYIVRDGQFRKKIKTPLVSWDNDVLIEASQRAVAKKKKGKKLCDGLNSGKFEHHFDADLLKLKSNLNKETVGSNLCKKDVFISEEVHLGIQNQQHIFVKLLRRLEDLYMFTHKEKTIKNNFDDKLITKEPESKNLYSKSKKLVSQVKFEKNLLDPHLENVQHFDLSYSFETWEDHIGVIMKIKQQLLIYAVVEKNCIVDMIIEENNLAKFVKQMFSLPTLEPPMLPKLVVKEVDEFIISPVEESDCIMTQSGINVYRNDNFTNKLETFRERLNHFNMNCAIARNNSLKIIDTLKMCFLSYRECYEIYFYPSLTNNANINVKELLTMCEYIIPRTKFKRCNRSLVLVVGMNDLFKMSEELKTSFKLLCFPKELGFVIQAEETVGFDAKVREI